MKKKLFTVTISFICILTAITVLFYSQISNKGSEETKREQAVALNEIEQLAKQITGTTLSGDNHKLHSFIASLREDILSGSIESTTQGQTSLILIFYIVCILFLLLIFGYVYRAILRPFDKMKNYAQEIANGNLDITLNYERSNYFGAYTWAFDHMRSEIIKARSCEKESILNNKTVIATLSHDIKSPIASIRAYTEGLEANLDSTIEKRQHYLSTIMAKCDEVTKLTNDLFLHSLSDLDKLKMEFEEIELSDFLQTNFRENDELSGKLQLILPFPEKTMMIDQKRLKQAVDNLINNSKKYADSRMELSAVIEADLYCIHLRDYGPGIPNEDMPFIMDKFYRGRNAGEQDGSGLGLYIVTYIMKQHGGQLKLYNHSVGLEAVLALPMK